MKLSAPEQCAANVVAWLAHHGFDPKMDPFIKDQDRTWFIRNSAWDAFVSRMLVSGATERRSASNHGVDVVDGYRECVSRCAAQVIVHRGSIEIDFDMWQPWDLVGWVGHGIEVAKNKIGKRKTDPFKIAEQLRKRGIHANVAI